MKLGTIPTVVLVLSMLVSAPSPPCWAHDCIDYGDYLHWVGGVDTPQDARGVAIAGNYAYVADGGWSGLQVIDISVPESPEIVGSVVTPGSPMGVAAAGSYVYVADWDSGLVVIDVAVPESPEVVGSVDTPGSACGVTVASSYAYLADGGSGLQVIDVSVPESPEIVGSEDTPGWAWGVTVASSYAYVADDLSGLQVFDVSVPESPEIVGSEDTPGRAWGVTVASSYAYVADTDAGLQVIDVSVPESPGIVGSENTPGWARGVAVTDSYAYVVDDWCGLQVIDVSVPESPEIVGSADTQGYARGVAVADSYAYVADDVSGLQVFDISVPESPPIVGSVVTLGDARGVAVAGSYAYVAGDSSGLQVIDVSVPESPEIVGSEDTPGRAYGVTVVGSYAYVADSESGLQVIDISVPGSPEIVGSENTPDRALGVTVAGSYAYVADNESGLQVIDVAVPELPEVVGSVDTPGRSCGVTVAGSYAYVADGDAGLQVIDISVPESPEIVGSENTPGGARGVAVAGSYAYVADFHPGLQVIDVSVPGLPEIVGSLDTPDDAVRVAVAGNHAYVADKTSGLQVIDISNPGSPKVVGSVENTPGTANDVAVGSSYVYVADEYSGLQIAWRQCDGTGNQPPTAYIDAIYPSPADEGEEVTLEGHGEDPDGAVVAYDWQSSNDGYLSDQASFSTSALSAGTHTIDFKVQDDEGEWSPSDFAELTVIPEYSHATLLEAVNDVEAVVLEKIDVMTSDLAVAETWAYKAIYGTDAIAELQRVLGAEGVVQEFLMWFLEGQVSPSGLMSLGISLTINGIVNEIHANEVDSLWAETTNSIFNELGEELGPDPNDSMLYAAILDILLHDPAGPQVWELKSDVKARFSDLRQYVSSHDLPDPTTFGHLTSYLWELSNDIAESNIHGEHGVVKWYCPAGYTAPPNDSKVYLMGKMGDWTANADSCDYVETMDFLLDKVREERKIQATAYSIKHLLISTVTLLSKASFIVVSSGVSLAFEGVAMAVWGVSSSLAGASYDLQMIEPYKKVATANLEIMNQFSKDLGFLDDVLVEDVTIHVQESMQPGPPPEHFPWSTVELQSLDIPDIIEVEPGEGMAACSLACASITVRNTGPNAAKVNCFLDIKCVGGPHEGKTFSLTGPTELMELGSGEIATIPIEFSVPSPVIYGVHGTYVAIPDLTIGTSHVWNLAAGYTPLELLLDGFFTVVQAGKYGPLREPAPSLVMADSVLEGEAKSTSYTPGEYETAFWLVYDSGDLDLHIYDSLGRHTGLNYETGLMEFHIPNSSYTGPSSLPEIITVNQSAGEEYTVEVVGIRTDGYQAFCVYAMETPEQPATMDVRPPVLRMVDAPADTAKGAIVVSEVGGHHDLQNLELTAGDFVGDSYTIPSSSFSWESTVTTISAGGLKTPWITIRIPNDAPAGEYTGDLQVTSSGGSEQVTIRLRLDNPPDRPDVPAGPTSGSSDSLYTYTTSTIDPDGDQIHYIFSWDDHTPSDWYGPFASGESCLGEHSWTEEGTYGVTVAAIDTLGQMSAWSDTLSVIIGPASAVKERSGDLPIEYMLEQISPNPFSLSSLRPEIVIRYGLPENCRANIKVFDVLGRRVATLVDGWQEAGYKTARWNVGSSAGGVYFCRLEAGDTVKTMKVVLLSSSGRR